MKLLGPCLLFALLLTGCTSYVSSLEPGRDLRKYQVYFVKANFDDNHGMDSRIARALQERGYTVDKGPMTMMPRATQAIVTYQDHWSWDFKTHLTGLRIVISDAKSETIVASGNFTGPAALSLSTDDAVDRLLDKIFKAKPLPTPPAELKNAPASKS